MPQSDVRPSESDISEALWEVGQLYGFRPTVGEQVAIAARIRQHARRIPTGQSVTEACRAVGVHSPRGFGTAVRDRLARLYPEPSR